MIAGVSVEAGREAMVFVSEPGSWVGLSTGACTERAATAEESTGHLDRSIRDWQERHR